MVTISLHPDVLLPHARALDVEGSPGHWAYAAGREALAAAYETYAAMGEAERALREAAGPAFRRQLPSGRSVTAGAVHMAGGSVRQHLGHEQELADAADRAFQRAAQVIDRRAKELEGHRAALRARVNAALDDPSRRTAEGLSVAAEVRAHVKALAEGERLAFVKAAVDRGDRRVVSALFAAPPFLSGLTDEQQGTMRELAAARLAGQDHAQLCAVEAVIQRVQAAGGHLVGRYAKIVGRVETPRARAAKKVRALAEGGTH